MPTRLNFLGHNYPHASGNKKPVATFESESFVDALTEAQGGPFEKLMYMPASLPPSSTQFLHCLSGCLLIFHLNDNTHQQLSET